jgi:hypothetical protein
MAGIIPLFRAKSMGWQSLNRKLCTKSANKTHFLNLKKHSFFNKINAFTRPGD